jgi:hypothetical protein
MIVPSSTSCPGEEKTPNLAAVPTILPDGRPVIYPSNEHFNNIGEARPGGNPLGPEKYEYGPLVLNTLSNEQSVKTDELSLTALAGPAGATWLGSSPDGTTAYVQSTEALDEHYSGATGSGVSNIYAISTAPTAGVKPAGGGRYTGATCVSCTTGQGEAAQKVTFLGLSRDGSHLLFSTEEGLWSWTGHTVTLLVPAAEEPTGPSSSENGLLNGYVSENGLYALAKTKTGLREIATETGAEIATIEGCGTPAGVSNHGTRVICDYQPPEVKGQLPPQVIDEWSAGVVSQISPDGSPNGYEVQRIAGGELEDVFFLSNEPLLPADGNVGNADIYDARAQGGFPPCTSGDPLPPQGVVSCLPGSSQNPVVPPITPHVAPLALLTASLPPLPADTSRPAATSKPLSRAQKLAKALKACRKKPHRTRAACERHARNLYAAKTPKRSGRR